MLQCQAEFFYNLLSVDIAYLSACKINSVPLVEIFITVD
jgi:hypothetical protein